MELIYEDDSHGENGPDNTLIRNSVWTKNGNVETHGDILVEANGGNTNVISNWCNLALYGNGVTYIDRFGMYYHDAENFTLVTHDFYSSQPSIIGSTICRDYSYYLTTMPTKWLDATKYTYPCVGPSYLFNTKLSNCIPALERRDAGGKVTLTGSMLSLLNVLTLNPVLSPESNSNGFYYKINNVVTNSIHCPQNTVVKIEAIPPSSDFVFAGWYDNTITGWSNGNINKCDNPINYPVNNNSILYATFAKKHESNDPNAFKNSSQQKVVRTTDGYLHMVYESMNKVWYERSTDDGASWNIMNNGRPLSINNSKNPSIDYYNGFTVGIVYQEEYFNENKIDTYKIQFMYFNSFDGTVSPKGVITLQDKPGVDYGSCHSPYSFDANPVVAISENGSIVFVWQESDLVDYPFLMCKSGGFTYNGGVGPVSENTLIPGSNASCPTISIAKGTGSVYHLAYQMDYCIYYCNPTVNFSYSNGTSTCSISTTTPVAKSDNTGYSNNIKPSIVAVSDGARLTWVGSRTVYQSSGDAQLSKTQTIKLTGSLQQNAVFKDVGINSKVWTFGNNVQSSVINSSPQVYSIAWSRSNTDSIQFADSRTLKSITSLPIFGQYLQLSNGITNGNSTYSEKAVAYNTSSSPYSFKNKNLYLLANSIRDEGTLLSDINSSREGVVSAEDAQFYFAIGDVSVDNNNVDFEQIPDTTQLQSLSDINNYLVTKPILVVDNSALYYSVQYGISDSSASVKALRGHGFVNFKVDILDAETNELLGTSDNVNYDSAHVFQYDNIAYQLNTEGISNRRIKLRLNITSNANTGYSLKNSFTKDDEVLAKRQTKRTMINLIQKVDSYNLSQNYPNPFNPTTTINYQIPKPGIVSIKVYDILGKVVANLVNEFKQQGRYNITFDASRFASGVYIYQIKSNEYTSSKKMMLIK